MKARCHPPTQESPVLQCKLGSLTAEGTELLGPAWGTALTCALAQKTASMVGGGAVQVSKERKGTFQQERGSEGQGKQLQLIFPSLPSNREGVEAGWEHG